jgi:hypothetical protein
MIAIDRESDRDDVAMEATKECDQNVIEDDHLA